MTNITKPHIELPDVAEEALLKTIHPTMSKADLLVACSYPWGKRAPVQPAGEGAAFGSAFHDVAAGADSDTAAQRFNVDHKELVARVAPAFRLVTEWLGGKNPYKRKFPFSIAKDTELPIAYDVEKGVARACQPVDEHHIYPDVDYDRELPGTADIAIAARKTILILDYKTGAEVPNPLDSGQLKTLALAFAAQRKCADAIIGFVHAPRDQEPSIYTETMSNTDLVMWGDALKAAWRRRGDGSLTPNDGCAYCPALMICPTQTSMLIELRRGKALALTPERVGAIHQMIGVYDELAQRLRGEIRAYVRANPQPCVRPDGKILEIVTRTYESLSKASIVEALGKIAGEREIERLRKMDCVKSSDREELRAVKE